MEKEILKIMTKKQALDLIERKRELVLRFIGYNKQSIAACEKEIIKWEAELKKHDEAAEMVKNDKGD